MARMRTVSFQVIGVIKTGVEEMDRGMALVSISDVQRLLGLDKAVTDIVIRVHSLNHLDSLAQTLRKQLAGPRSGNNDLVGNFAHPSAVD